jgi:3-oxoacyl-[acyl-carrier protein] reductase
MTTSLLSGRGALVVGGGGGGIGTAVCTTLATHGAAVAVADASSERAGATVTEVAGLGGKSVAIIADIEDRGSADQMLQDAWEQLDGIDIVVTVVGGTRAFGYAQGPVHELADAELEHTFDLNVGYVFRVVRAAIRACLEHGTEVSIVSVSSIAGGPPGAPKMSAYGAAKAALNSLGRSVAVEYGSRGVRMNLVAPGFVATTVTPRAGMEHQVPLGRPAQPQDIANAVLFFASPLSSYVTGQLLAVDGGATCRFPD